MSIQSIGTQAVPAWPDKAPAASAASVTPLPAKDTGTVLASVKAPPPPTQDQVTQAVSRLEKALAPLTQELQLSVDKDSGDTVIKIIDTASKKVLRQFPSEEILNLAKSLGDYQQGLLVEQKV